MRAKTPDQVRKEFNNRGESFSEWARANGFHVQQVFEVLSGRHRCIRGDAHRIAVKLGLKRRTVEPPQT
jgi:gp16 family phage-associated protein